VPAVVSNRPSKISGGATPLLPPVLVNPQAGSADVAFQQVTFEFQPTPGADEYQIQVSTSSLFPQNNRFESAVIRDTRQGVTLSRTFTNLIVPGAAVNVPIFWRVGGRNSRDGGPPTGEGISGPNDNGFVFAAAQTFTLREQPPNPPGQQRVLNGTSAVSDAAGAQGAHNKRRGGKPDRPRRRNRRDR
jgi:hypothetical protein